MCIAARKPYTTIPLNKNRSQKRQDASYAGKTSQMCQKLIKTKKVLPFVNFFFPENKC